MASRLDRVSGLPREPGQESSTQFASRKVDHLRLSLDVKNQAVGHSGLERVEMIHEALPDLNFSDVKLNIRSLGKKWATPFLVSSMTAGHHDSVDLNRLLARACVHQGWRMGVGSQRRELDDAKAAKEWRDLRKSAPKVALLGNLGLAQLIRTPLAAMERLVDALEAEAMIIHLNPLQECLQPEGTPQYRGGLKALERLSRQLSVPVVVKETGCGFSESTLKRLRRTGVAAVDVSGMGGTHWGRIEGDRNVAGDIRQAAAQTLQKWGISTVDALAAAVAIGPKYEIWASGGVRSGLDAVKLLAMGADTVGFAMPILAAALRGEEAVLKQMSTFEFELKTCLFCTGHATIAELHKSKSWRWRTT